MQSTMNKGEKMKDKFWTPDDTIPALLLVTATGLILWALIGVAMLY